MTVTGNTFSEMPILILEDSDEDFDTFEEAMRKACLDNPVIRATTGDHCLQRINGAGHIPLRPAIILIDLNTPGMDGRETLALLKSDPRWRCFPVVVLTTSNNPRDLEYCYQLGANAYHVKPVQYQIHLQILVDLLSYWLQRVILPESDATIS